MLPKKSTIPCLTARFLNGEIARSMPAPMDPTPLEISLVPEAPYQLGRNGSRCSPVQDHLLVEEGSGGHEAVPPAQRPDGGWGRPQSQKPRLVPRDPGAARAGCEGTLLAALETGGEAMRHDPGPHPRGAAPAWCNDCWLRHENELPNFFLSI
jgi:hypothetical protein